MAQKSAQPAGTVEHIPSSEHGRAFPPFDAQTFASQLFWFALAFIALYLLMSRVALPRIGSILEARRQRVDGDLAEAQRLKDQSDAAIAAHEKPLAPPRRGAKRWMRSSMHALRKRKKRSPRRVQRQWPTCTASRAIPSPL